MDGHSPAVEPAEARAAEIQPRRVRAHAQPNLPWLQSTGISFLFLLPLGFLVLFYVYPLASILRLSFTPDATLGAGGFEAAGAALLQSSFWQVAWFTTWQA